MKLRMSHWVLESLALKNKAASTRKFFLTFNNFDHITHHRSSHNDLLFTSLLSFDASHSTNTIDHLAANSLPSPMAGNTTGADILHEVHDAASNTTTITVRDTSSADPVREASSEVMKARKISRPKGKSTARPAMTSAVPASMDSMANPNQGTGLQFPTVPPTAQSTLPAMSNTSEPRDPAATPSLAKPATRAKPSRLADRMKEQQHEPSFLGSLLDDIAQPTTTTYTVEGPSTKLGSLRGEINQPLVPTYVPQPLTFQSPPMQQDQPSRNGTRPDEIDQPTAATYSLPRPTSQLPPMQQGQTSRTGSPPDEISQPTVTMYARHPPTSQFPLMQQGQPSRNGTRPGEIDQPTAATHSSNPPTSLILPNTIKNLISNMADSNTMGSPETDGDHSPPEASKPAQNQGPAVTRNKEGKPTLKFGPKAQVSPDQQQQQRSTIGSVPDEISKPAATPYNPNPPASQSHSKQVESTSSELVVSSASIIENQDVIPGLPSLAGVVRQNAPLVVPQPSQLPASPVITQLAASVNSNIPLFHPSMLPNPNKHFTATQNPASSGSYGYSSQISTASFSTQTSPLFGQALQPTIPYALPSASPSMSEILRDSPTNPNWKPTTHAFVPSVPHTPWPLQRAMDHDEGELSLAPDTLSSIWDDPKTTSTAVSDEMEDLKPTVAAIILQPVYRPTVDKEMEDTKPEVSSVVPEPVHNLIMNSEMEDLRPEVTSVVPEPMYKPTVDNELGDLDNIPGPAHSPSTVPYIEEQEVPAYDAEPTLDMPPAVVSQPMFHKAGNITSGEIVTENVPVITKDEPSSSEEAGAAPECSETVQNIEIKQVALDPKYFEYRNKEARKSRPFHWDIEDNRNPRSEYDCTDEDTNEIITKLEQLKLRVPECPTTALNNESRVTECSRTTLDEIRGAESPITALKNEIQVTEFHTTALKNEPRVIESATQAPDKETRVIECPTLNNESQVIESSNTALYNKITVTGYPDTALGSENPVIESSTKVLGNESRADDCSTTGLNNESRIIDCSTTTSNNEIVQFQMRPNKEKTMSDLHAAFMKEHLRAEELDKKLKEVESKRISIWRRTVEEAAAKRTKPFEITTAEKLAELDHKESLLRDERKQFETDCAEMEEDLKLREQKLASNEREYARRLQDLQTREAQVAESSKQLELQQEEQKERDKTAASKLKDAQEELERLKEEMFSSTSDCDSDIEYDWSLFVDARVSEDPQQTEQNSMFSSTWNIEEPQQIEQNSMFANTWNIEERVANIPGTSTGSHWKWMLPLLLVLALLSSTVPKLLQQPLSSRPNVTSQHLPDTCSFAERPVTISSSISQPNLLCLADYSNNYSEASSFPAYGFTDFENDLEPFGERVVGIGSVSHTKTSPSTLAIFKTWFWNFVLTGTAHGKVGVEAGRRELYH
jgi:hypothetical protein